jgi:hypothetical protein
LLCTPTRTGLRARSSPYAHRPLFSTHSFLHAEGSVVWFDQEDKLATYVILQPSWLYHEVVGPALAPATREFEGRTLHGQADSPGVVTASLFEVYYRSRGVDPVFSLAVMHALALYYQTTDAGGQLQFIFPAVLDNDIPQAAWAARSDLHCAGRRIFLSQPALHILPPGLLPKLQVKLAATGDAMLGAGGLAVWHNALIWKTDAMHLLVQLRDSVLGNGIDTSLVDIFVRFLDSARRPARCALALVLDFATEHCEGLDTEKAILSSAWLRDGQALADAPWLPLCGAVENKPTTQLLFPNGSNETAESLLLGQPSVPADNQLTQPCPAARPIFISLRFAEAQSEACALQTALRTEGVDAFVCDEAPGCELQQTVVDALYGCSLVVILGTQTYGRKTLSTFSTYEELRAIIAEKIPFFLVKMCQEFSENTTRFSLPTTIAYYAWQPASIEDRSVAPPALVAQIIARLRQAGGNSERKC